MWSSPRSAVRLFSTATKTSVNANFDSYFFAAANRMPATGGMLDVVRMPDSVTRMSFPINGDQGSMKVIQAYRVIHSNHHRPVKGGLKFDKVMAWEDIGALAAMNSIRFSLADIPWGGAKGGIAIDISQFSEKEQKRILRTYAHQLITHSSMSPSSGLISPDYGCDTNHLGILLGSYRYHNPRDVNPLAVVLGKTVDQGGVSGITGTFGLGFGYGIQECVRRATEMDPQLADSLGKNFTWNGRTATIQGFGYVGSEVAGYISEEKGAVTTIIEKNVAIHNPAGLNVEDVRKYFAKTGNLEGYPNARTMEVNKGLHMPCDVFIPAAKENSINANNVHMLQCKILGECAVLPTTARADGVLADRGVFVVPDLCTTVAADLIHYVEWLKGLTHIRYGRMERRFEMNTKSLILDTIEEVAGKNVNPLLRSLAGAGMTEQELVRTMVQDGVHRISVDVSKRASADNTSFRIAATTIGLEKILRVYQNNGIFP